MRHLEEHRRKFRLGIACDEPATCNGLKTVFHAHHSLQLVWLPVKRAPLLQTLGLLHVDALMLDRACVGEPDIEDAIVASGFQKPVIHWQRTTGEEPDHHIVLDKRADPLLLQACVETVLAGKPWTYSGLPSHPIVSDAPVLSAPLSPREADLINLVAEGLTNREIAQRLRLKEGSVKVYFSRLFQKLGVQDRLGLVLYSMQVPVPAQRHRARRSREHNS